MRVIVKVSLYILLGFYLALLTKLVLFKYSFSITHIFEYRWWASSNIVPFKTISFYLFEAKVNMNTRINNLVGNIIGFMPLGFLLPLLSKKHMKLKKIIVISFGLSSTYEVLQLLFGLGSFDEDDMILNTLGGVIGYVVVNSVILVIKYISKQLVVRTFRTGQRSESIENNYVTLNSLIVLIPILRR